MESPEILQYQSPAAFPAVGARRALLCAYAGIVSELSALAAVIGYFGWDIEWLWPVTLGLFFGGGAIASVGLAADIVILLRYPQSRRSGRVVAGCILNGIAVAVPIGFAAASVLDEIL